MHALQTALAWPNHTLSTISDLVQNLDGLDESLRAQVWDVVDDWIKGADDSDRAALREKIRVSTFTRRALRRRKRKDDGDVDERSRAAYKALEPTDPVLRHSWLFKQAWVDESADEIADEEFDYKKRDERISQLRQSAIEEVLAHGGISEVFRLADSGQAQHTAGWYLSKAIIDLAPLKAALLEVVGGEAVSGGKASFIGGVLAEATNRKLGLLGPLIADQPDEVRLSILLIAPFELSTWNVVEKFSDDLQSRYWQDIAPGWNRTDDDVRYAVRKLVEAGRPRAAFNFAHFDLKELRIQDVFDLLSAIAHGSNETSKSYLLDPHHLRDAFKLLNASQQIGTDDMAGLEFQFVDIFDEDKDVGLVNLERRIEAHPALFVEAIKYSFIRDDDGEDAPEPELTEAQRSNRASSCYKMLDRLSVIPGHDNNGALVADRIVSWVEQVRAGCTEIARGDIGDQMIGKLLSHAPEAEDGIWPCLPVRDALEQVMNKHLSRGLTVAMRNSRGAHWRGEGGAQEREIVAKYADWAQSMEYTHPRVAAMLHELEESYLRDADWEDSEAKITRRMRY
jgi:hypothetical protein